jgi:hypothetical protein
MCLSGRITHGSFRSDMKQKGVAALWSEVVHEYVSVTDANIEANFNTHGLPHPHTSAAGVARPRGGSGRDAQS